MALSTPALKTDDVQNFTGGNDHESSSFSVVTGEILTVFGAQMNSTGATAPGAISIADTLGGLSWALRETVPVDSGLQAGMRLNVWTAVATGNATGTVEITGTDVPLSSLIAVIGQTGQHATTPVPQSEQNSSANNQSTLSVSQAGAPAATSCVIGAVANEDDDTTGSIAPADSDFTELTDFVTAVGAVEMRMQVQYRDDAGSAGQVCDWSGLLGSFSCKAGAAIEVAEAAGGVATAPPVRRRDHPLRNVPVF